MQTQNKQFENIQLEDIKFDRGNNQNFLQKGAKKYQIQGNQKLVDNILKEKSKAVLQSRKEQPKKSRRRKINRMKEIISKTKKKANLRPALRLNSLLQAQLALLQQKNKKPKLRALRSNQNQIQRLQQMQEKQSNDFKLKKMKLLLDSQQKLGKLLEQAETRKEKKEEKVKKEEEIVQEKKQKKNVEQAETALELFQNLRKPKRKFSDPEDQRRQNQFDLEERQEILQKRKNRDLGDVALAALFQVNPLFGLAGMTFKLAYENREEIFDTFGKLKEFVSKKFGKSQEVQLKLQQAEAQSVELELREKIKELEENIQREREEKQQIQQQFGESQENIENLQKQIKLTTGLDQEEIIELGKESRVLDEYLQTQKKIYKSMKSRARQLIKNSKENKAENERMDEQEREQQQKVQELEKIKKKLDESLIKNAFRQREREEILGKRYDEQRRDFRKELEEQEEYNREQQLSLIEEQKRLRQGFEREKETTQTYFNKQITLLQREIEDLELKIQQEVQKQRDDMEKNVEKYKQEISELENTITKLREEKEEEIESLKKQNNLIQMQMLREKDQLEFNLEKKFKKIRQEDEEYADEQKKKMQKRMQKEIDEYQEQLDLVDQRIEQRDKDILLRKQQKLAPKSNIIQQNIEIKKQEIQQPKMEEVQQPKMEEVQQPKMEEVQQPKMEKVQQPKMEEVQQPKKEVKRKLVNEMSLADLKEFEDKMEQIPEDIIGKNANFQNMWKMDDLYFELTGKREHIMGKPLPIRRTKKKIQEQIKKRRDNLLEEQKEPLQQEKQPLQKEKQPLQQEKEFLEKPQQQEEEQEEEEEQAMGEYDPLNQKQFLDNLSDNEGEGGNEEFEGLTKKEFTQYFYESIADEIEKDFQYSIIEQNQKIPKLQSGNVFNIVVFFFTADKNGIGRHFTVFIHDDERKQIYYFDPLGIVQNEAFQIAQQKIQEYIKKLPNKIKLKINSMNAQESFLSKGQQQNDENYCAIYSLIFINRICVDLEDFKTATNFNNLDEEEKEQQKDILKKGTGNEYFMFQ